MEDVGVHRYQTVVCAKRYEPKIRPMRKPNVVFGFRALGNKNAWAVKLAI